MKWYSVKKYRPTQYGKFLVYNPEVGGCSIAYCETYPNGTYQFFSDEAEQVLMTVTHFMNIPPVEIDK